MKKMKLVSILVLAIGFVKCASAKFDKNPPFTITSATYTNWVGGVEGASGTNINIAYTSDKEVVFDSIYFRGKVMKASLKGSGKNTSVMAQFSTSTVRSLKDLQLHEDATKEYGNKAPKVADFPFELKDNEAVISYIENEEIKYYKVQSLEKGEQPMYQ